MNLRLENKRALVTGSSSGIGEAIAKILAAEGAAVVVHGRKEAEARRVAEVIRRAGGRVYVVLGDLAAESDAVRVADETLAALGGVDILVNNAGAYPQKLWFETTADEWNELYNQNVGSMVRMITRLVPGMKERGWGRVIQIASVVGTKPVSGLGNYSATKSANIMLTVSLALELAGTGVTANTVSPGPILTKGVEEMIRSMAKERDWGSDWGEMERRFIAEFAPTLTQKIGHPEDVGNLVAFLASPLAGNITCANFRVDGGATGTAN